MKFEKLCENVNSVTLNEKVDEEVFDFVEDLVSKGFSEKDIRKKLSKNFKDLKKEDIDLLIKVSV